MSKLEELIQEYCPDGVEYKKIKDVFQRLKGTPITAGKMKEIENSLGEIRIFAGGKTVINAHEEDIPKANITRVPAVLVQSRGVIDVAYYDKPFTFKNEMWAYTHDNQISVKYLYHVLKNNIETFREAASGMGSLPQISLKVTEDFKIPIPPLPVQEEIVRILDMFTSLTAELQAELQARKKQYAYYRDELLKPKVDTPMVKIKDICNTICSGGTPNSKNKEYYGGNIPWLRTQEINFTEINNTELTITEEGLKNSSAKWIKKNCVIVAMYGATVGKIAYNTIPLTTNQACCNLEINSNLANYKYIFYCLSNQYEYIKSLGQGSQSNINAQTVKGLVIPLPPLSEQQRIVEILDRFDTLCNDLTSGLPAEIAARQKQYAYYRDKLLTFKEKRTQ